MKCVVVNMLVPECDNARGLQKHIWIRNRFNWVCRSCGVKIEVTKKNE